MWRPWNVGAFISHPPQLTICQSQRMPFLSFSVQALVPTCLLLPAICICIFKHDFSTFRINNVFGWLVWSHFQIFFIPQRKNTKLSRRDIQQRGDFVKSMWETFFKKSQLQLKPVILVSQNFVWGLVQGISNVLFWYTVFWNKRVWETSY